MQLNESINAFMESILAHYTNEHRAKWHTIYRGLATVLLLRYKRTRNPADLTHALQRYEETLSMQAQGHPLRT